MSPIRELMPKECAQLELLISQTRTFTGGAAEDNAESSS